MQKLWLLIKIFFSQPAIKFALEYILKGWFIWAPVFAAYLFWESWINYIHTRFVNSLSWTLLEIKIPREITKSPRAMELILSALHNTKSGNFADKYWKGFLKMWYSFEIVSVEGQIHFLIYVQTPFRNFVEAQIYSQYPGAEVSEVDDYADIVSPRDIGKDWEMWGTELALVKEDAYPIRTYVDFGLDTGKTKEEEKIDPLTSFLESLGSLKEGEQIWFQILIRAADSDWKSRAEAVAEELQKKKGAPGEEDEFTKSILSPGKREVLTAVERNVSKLGYETGIRAVYLAKKESYNGIRPVFLLGAMKQYSTQNMNGFKPDRTTSVDYLFKKTREAKKKSELLRAFQQRSYFYIPFRRKSFVLNTEGLATIYHFPGRVAETPTLGRIESKRGEPPINLPI